MTAVDEIAVGWLVYEKALPGSDYTLRGGYVIEITGDPDKPAFKTMDVWRGQLKQFELRSDQVDVESALRPSLQQSGPLESLIKRILAEVSKEKDKRLSGHARWLVDVAYKLVQKAPG